MINWIPTFCNVACHSAPDTELSSLIVACSQDSTTDSHRDYEDQQTSRFSSTVEENTLFKLWAIELFYRCIEGIAIDVHNVLG